MATRNLTDRELREVYFVPSSDPTKEDYEVFFSKKDKIWLCNCKWFTIKRQQCRHITYVLEEYGFTD